MHVLLIVMFLLAQESHRPITAPNAPPSIQRGASYQPAVPNIHHVQTDTTPDLNADAEIHAQMERDIGSQGEAIGQLQSDVTSLKDKREKIDRPDIDSLEDSRSHLYWTWSILTAVIATAVAFLWFLRGAIWRGLIRPNLAREIAAERHPGA